MRRKQVIYSEDSPPPKSIRVRFFSTVGSLLIGVSMLFMVAVAIGLIAILLEKWFPQHGGKQTSGSSRSLVPADVNTYFQAVGRQVNASGPSLGALTDSASAASAKPSIIKTAAWQKKTAAVCAALQNEGNALLSINPVPSDCAEMQKDVRLAGGRYETIAQEFSRGADMHHPDINTIHQAVAMIDLVTRQDDKRLVADSNKIRAKYSK